MPLRIELRLVIERLFCSRAVFTQNHPTIDASLGVGMVGGVKLLYAVLLALVLGVGCGTPSAGFDLNDVNQARINKAMPDAVLRHNDTLFVAYETPCGNIVSRIFAGKKSW